MNNTNAYKRTIKAFKPSLLMAIISCLCLTGFNAYAVDISRKALDAMPFWIQIQQRYLQVDPPAINLSSIGIAEQNSQWRTVDFYDSWGNVVFLEGSAHPILTLHSEHIASTRLTVDCTNNTVQGGLPRLQPQYWADMDDGDQRRAQAAQDTYEKRLVQLTCSAPISLKPHVWINVGQAVGRQTDPANGIPLTEYDRNNITIDPQNTHLRTVIAKDTTQVFGETTHIYNYAFNCQDKTLYQISHYVMRAGTYAEDESSYEAHPSLQAIDDITGQTTRVELLSYDIESQTDDLIYIFQQVCK